MDERVGGSGSVAGTSAVCASVPVVVRDLVKTYGAIKAVDHISFKLEPGTIVALLGGNGAGKTTTIAMLLGLVMPTAGEVRVFGADMARDRGAVAHRMNFQSPYVDLPMRLTVRENLTVYAGLYGVANTAPRIAYVADDLHIEPLLDRLTGKLGGTEDARARRSPCSMRLSFSCSTSRPPRSIPTPPTDQAEAQDLRRNAATLLDRLAQHGGGRAPADRDRARRGPHCRGWHAASADRDLRPRDA
jgi:ABC-2 type transport system ATP-binding protein